MTDSEREEVANTVARAKVTLELAMEMGADLNPLAVQALVDDLARAKLLLEMNDDQA